MFRKGDLAMTEAKMVVLILEIPTDDRTFYLVKSLWTGEVYEIRASRLMPFSKT